MNNENETLEKLERIYNSATPDEIEQSSTELKNTIKTNAFIKEGLKALEAVQNEISESNEWVQLVKAFPGLDIDMFFDAIADKLENEQKAVGESELVSLESLTENAILILQNFKPNETTGKKFEDFINSTDFEKLKEGATDTVAAELIPYFKGLPYNNCLYNNTKVFYSLQDIINKGDQQIFTSKDKQLYIIANISLPGVELTGNITAFDRQVFNGVCTLIAAGNTMFTPTTVYNAMNGATELRASPKQVKQIETSLAKMASIQCKIDVSIEYQKRGILKPNETLIYSSYMLPLEHVEARNNRGEIKVYKLIKETVLYTYAKEIHQLISIKNEILQIKDSNGKRVNNSNNLAEIRDYLIMRIEWGKSEIKRNNKPGEKKTTTIIIKLETLYNKCGAESKSHNAKFYMRNTAENCLKYWARIGYINSYKLIQDHKENNTYTKIEIIISETGATQNAKNSDNALSVYNHEYEKAIHADTEPIKRIKVPKDVYN